MTSPRSSRCAGRWPCVLDPAALTAEVAAELLTGPLGGVDAVALRRLRQALRARELGAGGDRSSDELLVAGAARPRAARPARPARRAGGPPGRGRSRGPGGQRPPSPARTPRRCCGSSGSPRGSPSPWRRRALSGGAAGARADRDLDAVVALFEAAARFVDRLPARRARGLPRLPRGPGRARATRSPSAHRPSDSVTLVTPHGAAGREWDVVVDRRPAGGRLARPAAAQLPARRAGARRRRRRAGGGRQPPTPPGSGERCSTTSCGSSTSR